MKIYNPNKRLSYKKYIVFVIACIVIIGSIAYYLKNNDFNNDAKVANARAVLEEDIKPVQEVKPDVVKLTFVGDILMHGGQRKSAYDKNTNSYNFDGFFEDVKKYFDNRDFVIGSLETPIVKQEKDSMYSGYPNFKNPPQYVEAIKNAGINTVVMANNHIVDVGNKGAIETVAWVEKNNIKYTGAFKSEEEKNTNPVLFLEQNNIKLGLVNYTQSTNGYSSNLVNYIDIDKIKRDIQYAKEQKVDKIIVWLHFGSEYQRSPDEYQKNLVKEVANAGADIIIGSHPHVIQPFEILDIEGRKVFVAYSLGNFISNQYWRYSTDGLILNMEIEKKDNIVSVKNINYIPTAVVREYTGNGNKNEKAIKTSSDDSDYITNALGRDIIGSYEVNYRIVPIKPAINNYQNKLEPKFTPNDYTRLTTSWDDTTTLIGQSEEYKLNSGIIEEKEVEN